MHAFRYSLIALLVAATAACGHTRVNGGGGGGGSGTTAGPVPEQVRKTVEALLGPGAKIRDEREDGKLQYEAVTRTKLEVELSEAGTLQKTEVALPAGALPTAVAAAASAKGTITEAEVVVTPNGIAFEVEVKTATGELELTIDAAGNLLSSEQEKADEGDEHDEDDKD